MVSSDVTSVEEYVDQLDPDRRETVQAVRQVVLDNLPEGYQEHMRWGMINYEVPLERYPDTYNEQPLMYAALASQKHHVSLYLSGVYADPEDEQGFESRFRASGKKLDKGRSCVRFKRADDLPLDLIGETIASLPIDEFVNRYEAARAAR